MTSSAMTYLYQVNDINLKSLILTLILNRKMPMGRVKSLWHVFGNCFLEP